MFSLLLLLSITWLKGKKKQKNPIFHGKIYNLWFPVKISPFLSSPQDPRPHVEVIAALHCEAGAPPRSAPPRLAAAGGCSRSRGAENGEEQPGWDDFISILMIFL